MIVLRQSSRERLARALVSLAVRLAPARNVTISSATGAVFVDHLGRTTLGTARLGKPSIEGLLDLFDRAPDDVGILLNRQTLDYHPFHLPHCLRAQLQQERDAILLRRRQRLEKLKDKGLHAADVDPKGEELGEAAVLIIRLHGSPFDSSDAAEGEGGGRLSQAPGRVGGTDRLSASSSSRGAA